MTTEHTTECETARAGHFFVEKDAWLGLVRTERPDPYPLMQNLSEDQRGAVLACPHPHHDIVRTFCQVTL